MLIARGAALLGVTALATWPGRARAIDDFSSTIEGLELRLEIGTGIYGYDVMLGLGAESLGVRAYDRRYLLSWNGDAEAVIGAVAYSLYALYGAQGAGKIEGGLRFAPTATLSPYLSASLGAALSAIAAGGVSFDRGTLVNNLDGVAGPYCSADARVGFGGSLLDASQSLVAEAQLLTELDSGQSNLPPRAYLGGALRARYDLRDSISAAGEMSYAFTPSQSNVALDTTTQTERWTLSAAAWKKLDRFFVGGGLAVSRTATQTSYANAASYDSAGPIDSRFWLLAGLWP